ncbi:MAG: glycosyltransferase [Phycisphaerae bacterium]|nr:glycosyltransferase [Phycisphaerae bacterium]
MTESSSELPELSLEHLHRLTDDKGLFQHARRTTPYRKEGYCTDDNARAVIATAWYYARNPEPEALELFKIYLAFTLSSQNGDGSVKNLMGPERRWLKNEPGNDALGRVLWALGVVLAEPPSPIYLTTAKDCFDNLIRCAGKQYQKGKAYSILGMSEYLKRFPEASDIKKQMETAAESLIAEYEENKSADWQWFDGALTYDNAILPYALFVAGAKLGNKYIEVAEKTCEFLLANTFNGDYFSFIGCMGWYKRGGAKAKFDQQPIEAASTVMMLRAAYDTTGNDRFLTLQRKAFDWFLGENDLHLPLYDSKSKGCHDGLMSDGINPNEGAESTLSFLLSLLAIAERAKKQV